MSLISKFIFMKPRQPRDPRRPQRKTERTNNRNPLAFIPRLDDVNSWRFYHITRRMDLATMKVFNYLIHKYLETDYEDIPFSTEFGSDIDLTMLFNVRDKMKEVEKHIKTSGSPQELAIYSQMAGLGKFFYWKIFGKYVGIHKHYWKLTTEDEITSIILFMIDYWFANREIYPWIRSYFPYVNYREIQNVFEKATRRENLPDKRFIYPQRHVYVGKHDDKFMNLRHVDEYKMFLEDAVKKDKVTYVPYPDSAMAFDPPKRIAREKETRPKRCTLVEGPFGNKIINLVSDYLTEDEVYRLKCTSDMVDDMLDWYEQDWYNGNQPFTVAEFIKNRPVLQRMSEIAPYVDQSAVEQIDKNGKKIQPFHHYVHWAEFELFVLHNYSPNIVGNRYEMIQQLRILWDQNVENAKRKEHKEN